MWHKGYCSKMDLEQFPTVDYFVAEKALDWENGDTAFVHGDSADLFVGIIDGAGHGPEAHTIAQKSRRFLEENSALELPMLMAKLHEELRGTRGGVAIIGKLDVDELVLRYVGIGNIVLKVFGANTRQELTQQGVIGHHIRTPQERRLQLSPGDVVVTYTDGIPSHVNINDYPRILRDDAKTIAKTLVNQFAKGDDDATCLVLRLK